MLDTAATANRGAPADAAESSRNVPRPTTRRALHRARGRKHGPIARLVGPSGLGELFKPFASLDHALPDATPQPLFGIHPHSGIATLTTVLSGGTWYEDTTGKTRIVPAGGFEWMKAGKRVWHDNGVMPGDPGRVFQLWPALPAAEECRPPESQYRAPAEVPTVGPIRVILGSLGRTRSVLRANSGINYLHVQLARGDRWRYAPPADHSVLWLAIDRGRVCASGVISAGEIAVFEESTTAIELEALAETSFAIGSVVKHPYPLVVGNYSVHTSAGALLQGETEIRRIGLRLRAKESRLGHRAS